MLLLIIEIIVRSNLYAFTSISHTILYHKKHIVRTTNLNKFNSLIMGDSRVLGLHAKEISKSVSKKTGEDYHFFNYSFPQSGVQSHYLLLKNYLKHQKKPKLIVMMSSPLTLTGEWNFQTLEKPYPISFYCFTFLYSVLETIKTMPPQSIIKTLLVKLEHTLKFVAYRKKIKKIIKNPSSYHNREAWVKRAMAQSNGGAMMARTVGPTIQEIKDSIFYQNKFRPDTYSINWYIKFFQLAQEHKIKIIILNAPLPEIIYQKREKDGFNKIYLKMMREIQNQFRNIYFANPLNLGYPMDHYGDEHHLNKKGFRLFTKEAGDIIATTISQYKL